MLSWLLARVRTFTGTTDAHSTALFDGGHAGGVSRDGLDIEGIDTDLKSKTSSWWRTGRTKTDQLCSIFEAELQDVIPICHATIAGTRIIGRLTAG